MKNFTPEEVYEKYQIDETLHLNVSLTYEIEPWYNNNDPFRYVDNAASVQKRYRSKHVHPDYLKLFMDGLPEMGTGFLLEGYSESPVDSIFSGHGTPLWSEEDMKTMVSAANSKGLTAHTHAMGDGAVHRCQFLQVLTCNGAWQLHLENERGSIEAGKYADFVILDENVLTCDVQSIKDVQVLKTFFEGREVYSR